MSLYRRGTTWWIDIAHRGQRVRESAGTDDKKTAQRYHDQRKAELWEEVRSGHTLADALGLWLNAAPRSDREKSAIRIFLAAYPSRPLTDVTGQAISAALADKSPGTANRTINILRAALRLAVQAGILTKAPVIPRRKEPVHRIRYLTPAEWQRLDAELPPHVQAPARFALATGMRQANVFGLQWRDIDLPRRVAWVNADQAKGAKAIGVPLNDAAVAAITSQIGQHQTHVWTYNGTPLRSPKKAWHAAMARAGIIDFTWHDLRHTWASWHVMNGTPLAVLRELGGWSSMDMVMRYAHLAPDHLAAWAGNAMPQNTAQKNGKAA